MRQRRLHRLRYDHGTAMPLTRGTSPAKDYGAAGAGPKIRRRRAREWRAGVPAAAARTGGQRAARTRAKPCYSRAWRAIGVIYRPRIELQSHYLEA